MLQVPGKAGLAAARQLCEEPHCTGCCSVGGRAAVHQKAGPGQCGGLSKPESSFELHLFLSSTAIASVCLGVDLFRVGGQRGTPALSDHVQLEGGHGHGQ